MKTIKTLFFALFSIFVFTAYETETVNDDIGMESNDEMFFEMEEEYITPG